MKIGLISDTHDYLDPQIAGLFSGVTHILHAGDIGLPMILGELELIAPVTAVSGNTDDPSFRYRETQLIELAGRRFFLQHIVDPLSPGDELRSAIARRRPDVVLFGHTHKQFSGRIGSVLFLNPGYSGKPRQGAARSVAILHCDENEIRTEFLPLRTGNTGGS